MFKNCQNNRQGSRTILEHCLMWKGPNFFRSNKKEIEDQFSCVCKNGSDKQRNWMPCKLTKSVI